MKSKEKHLIYIVFFFSVACFYACTSTTPLENVLKEAGDNRAELEKVLQHYSQHPEDSLKLQAARFLIANMHGKYSYDSPDIRTYYQKADSVFKDSRIHDLYELRLDTLLEAIDREKVETLPDAMHMTSELLIGNIDSAFAARERYDWCRRLSFGDFCEYVLPYRTGTAPLEAWRPLMQARFGAIVDSLVAAGAPDTTVCQAVCAEYFAALHYPKTFKPDYPCRLLFDMKVAPCIEWVNFGLYALRTFGMPVVCDFTPNWANRSMGHEWGVLRYGDNQQYLFLMGDREDHRKRFDKMAKAYRKTATAQQESLAMQAIGGEEIPTLFKDAFFSDVSQLYFTPVDITVDLEYPAPVPKRVAYIMVYDNQTWQPVHWGLVEKKKATFTKMNTGCMYLPCTTTTGSFIRHPNLFM